MLIKNAVHEKIISQWMPSNTRFFIYKEAQAVRQLLSILNFLLAGWIEKAASNDNFIQGNVLCNEKLIYV